MLSFDIKDATLILRARYPCRAPGSGESSRGTQDYLAAECECTHRVHNLATIELFQIQEVTISAYQQVGTKRKGRSQKCIVIRVW
jgi:hypothetical protein